MRLADTVAVIIATEGDTDSHGNPVVDWANATETLCPALVAPQNSSEALVGQNTVTTRYRVFLPALGLATEKSRIRWRGQLFDVDGDVELHTDLRGKAHHRELLMVAHRG